MIYHNICAWYEIWNGKPINSELVNPYNFIERNGRIYFLQHEAALFGKEYYKPNKDGIDQHFVAGYLDAYHGEVKTIIRFEDEYLAQVEQTIGQHAPMFGIWADQICIWSPIVDEGDEEECVWEPDSVDILRTKSIDCFSFHAEEEPRWFYCYTIPKKEEEHIALLYKDEDGCKCFFTRWSKVTRKLELLCLFMEEDNRIDVIGEMDFFIGYNQEHAYYMYHNQIYCIDTQEEMVASKVLDYSALCSEHQCKNLAFFDVRTETAFFYMANTSGNGMESLLGKVGLIGFDSNKKIKLVEQIPSMNNPDASIIFDGTKYVERVSGNRNGYIIYRPNGSIQERFISNSVKSDRENVFTVGDVVFLDWFDEERGGYALAYSSVKGLNLVFQEDVHHDLVREYKSESVSSHKLEVPDEFEMFGLEYGVLGNTNRKALNFVTVMNSLDHIIFGLDLKQHQQYLYELKDRIQRKMQANNLIWEQTIGYAGCLELPEELIDEFYEGRIHLDDDSIIREGSEGMETCKVGLILSCNEQYIYSYCDEVVYRTDVESFKRYHISRVVPGLKDRKILFVDAAREIFYYANTDGSGFVNIQGNDLIGMDIHGNKVIAFEAPGEEPMSQEVIAMRLNADVSDEEYRDALETLLFDGEKYIKLWMDHYVI